MVKKYRILYIFLIFCALLGLVYIYFNDPSEKPFIPCYFHALTGLECTGCGITRAIYCLMHFRIIDAIHFNAAFVFSIPLILYCLVKKLRDQEYKLNFWFLMIYTIILLIFTFVRNFTPVF